MVTTLISGDLTTGKIRQRGLPVSGGSCEQVLNAAGQITASVRMPLVDPLTGNVIPLLQTMAPVVSFLAYVQDGVVLNAGPLWSYSFDQDTRTLALSAEGLLSMFDHRIVAGSGSRGANGSFTADTVTYNGSLRGIANSLISDAISPSGAALPIDLEGPPTDSNTRTYSAANGKTVASALTDLTGVINGPDIMLVPYITPDGNYVRWAVQSGQPLANPAPPWVWNTSGPAPSAVGVTVNRSGETMATDSWETGGTDPSSSSGASLTYHYRGGVTSSTGLPFPITDVVTSHQDVTDSGTLQGYAYADQENGRYYTDTWTFKSRILAEPLLSKIRPGDFGQLNLVNHPILGTAAVAVRIMSVSVSLGDATASIACAPVRG